MEQRFLCIWFRDLTTDWLAIRKPQLLNTAYVFSLPVRGRAVVTAVSTNAQAEGIVPGMPLADAKAIVPSLEVFDDKPARAAKLLKAIGEWCIRYTPIVALNLPDGLILDISGCAHLWGGEKEYLKEIINRLRSLGYNARGAIASTIGTAWAVSRFGKTCPIIPMGSEADALLSLPPAALRLESTVTDRLHKLGLSQISSFISMPRSVLRRRFGQGLLLRLGQALGQEDEAIKPLRIIPPYHERLPCLEPIRTAKGIEIAIQRLLEMLCKRLHEEGMGLRQAVLTCYRIDGKVVSASIGTNRATHTVRHLFRLFELKITSIEPALGIELFTLDAVKTEEVSLAQEALWAAENPAVDDVNIAELLDRLAGRLGAETIHRYLPDEHYWPERSVKQASSLTEKALSMWRTDKPRPVELLTKPEPVEVSAPIPDYPPMLFRYQGKIHHIKKADGPERIEQEWWIAEGEHRDYYMVEDEAGQRYWLFRSGHYEAGKQKQWFIHGFFA